MKEVFPNLFIGDQSDFEREQEGMRDWAIVQACKEPYHRRALGYAGRGAPKGHPEYFFAYRGNRLILNLVDSALPSYIPDIIIEEAITFIDANLRRGKKVFVHCNAGASRSPSLVLAYLVRHTKFTEGLTLFESVEAKFKLIYPSYFPAGIREKVRDIFQAKK